MQKKRIFRHLVLSGIVLTLLAACGPQTIATSNNPVTSKSTTSTVPGKENLYILDGFEQENYAQRIVALHPGNSSTTQTTLPAGLFSQDRRNLYTAVPQNGQTTISVINTQTGKRTRSFTISGTYSTADQGYSISTLSADGKWLALRQMGKEGKTATFAIIDTQAGKLVKTFLLGNNFYLDAISLQGDFLYLIEKLMDQPDHYYVRAYDIKATRLIEQIIVDKAEIEDPEMIGSPQARQVAKDGKTVYTLYIDTARNIAFIHILPVVQDGINPPFLARCIEDLPHGKPGDLLRYYTLTLSADRKTLYATNGAIGVVLQITLADSIFDVQITNHIKFDPGDVSTATNKAPPIYHGAALSPDQRTLYFVGTRGIWAYSTTDAKLQGSYLTQQAFTSVATSSDGQMLYAVHPDSGITFLSLPSGKAQQLAPSPTQVPWGIESISDH